MQPSSCTEFESECAIYLANQAERSPSMGEASSDMHCNDGRVGGSSRGKFATAVACCGEFGDTIFVSQSQSAVLKTPQKTEGRGQCFPLLRQRSIRFTSVLFAVGARGVRTPG